MKPESDILIVGGGLNGPLLALTLAAGGFTVTMIDARPLDALKGAAFDGRAYALALASVRMLRTLGLWSDLAADSQPILEIIASDGRPGEGAAPWFLHFDHREVGEGPMGHMLEDRHLRSVLLERVEAEPGVTAIYGKPVIAQQVSASHASVELDDGRRISARLLVGCDGRDSPTAHRAGIRRSGWDYGQTALVNAIRHERPHNGVAHQFFMPNGPLGILPLPGDRCSIVWAETNARADMIRALSDDDYLRELRPRFGDFLGEIALEGARFSYALKLSIANSFIADRLALVGDAAHGIHPLAGQGLNLGFRDIAALAEVLVTARRRGEDVATGPVLARYQQWRRFDTAAMALTTDTINRLFSNDNPLLRLGRDLGMGLIDAAPGLRRGLIRQAAGLEGDLPLLMQGRMF